MINFLKYRWFCVFFALLLVVVSGFSYLKHGFRYSVDFTGGTQVLVKLSDKINNDDLKSILASGGYDGVDLREFENNEYLIRVQKFESDASGVGERIKALIQEKSSSKSVEILQADSVGASVGDSLKWNSMLALIIATLCMLAYIALRFRFAFSMGAIAALIHDVLVILTAFLVFNVEISPDVIAAILLILGYSVNDTIVIFARIRENISKMNGSSINEIVNKSLNETLRRTILTSFATLLVVLALIFLGGETLRNLSLALLLGIVFGTYSSIFIASPVMLLLYKKK